MKTRLWRALCACAIHLVSLSAQAEAVPGQGSWERSLQGRDLDGNAATVEAWYDSALDITWLADAGAAAQPMTWADARSWAARLNVYGVTGWRLPSISPLDGNSFDMTVSTNASTDHGYAGPDGWRDASGKVASELGHMYYVTLGNLGYCPPDGGDGKPETCDGAGPAGWGASNTGPFTRLHADLYWTGTPVDAGSAWGFAFNFGAQDHGDTKSKLFAWAVRSGDVGKPVGLMQSGAGQRE